MTTLVVCARLLCAPARPQVVGRIGVLSQAVKDLSGMVAEMAHLISGMDFDPFRRSNHEKCSSLWSAHERLHAAVVGNTGDLIDESFRQAVHEQALPTCCTIWPVRLSYGACPTGNNVLLLHL